MRNGGRVSVIIPALNEAQAIGNVLDAIPDWVDEVIVADNGSRDGTPEAATRPGVRVVHEPRRGYGSACLKGMASVDRPDIVVFLDADFSDHPEQMSALVDPILAGEVDMVIGSRALGRRERGALTPQARFGNILACFLMRMFWGVRYTDLGPFRAIRYSTLNQLGMADPDYGWTVEMQIKAALHGVRATEVPVDYRKRIGRSKVSGTVRGVVGAGYKILSTIFLSALRHHLGGKRPATGRRCIIVLSRYPEPGKTKTRLIPALGGDGAATLQRSMTEHAVRRARAFSAAELEVHYTGADATAMRAWLGDSLRYRVQVEGDLGARMAAAFEAVFHDGADRALLMGIDSPDIGPETHEAAFDALDTHDVVLGPATDGGYYLVGLRRSAADVAMPAHFTDIDWGTERVFEQTRARLDDAGLTLGLLAPLSDVDVAEDLPVWERNTADATALPALSVVIPALNEAELIGATLDAVMVDDNIQVVVVDGGSSDATAEIAADRGARVLHGPSCRAAQMNLGSAYADAPVLMFLHADTVLPEHFPGDVTDILARPGAVAGAFRFGTNLNSASMHIVEGFTNLRSRLLQLPYGDQALFLPKETFRRLGGFKTMALMEDFDLILRLRKRGRILIAPSSVRTCARRWRRLGIWRTMLRNQIIVALYVCGVSVERLARYYRKSA